MKKVDGPRRYLRALVGVVVAVFAFGLQGCGTRSEPTREVAMPAADTTAPPGFLDDGLLTASVTPATGAGEVLDLCVDEEAIRAGLDGGRLDQARSLLGIDCVGASTNERYVFVGFDAETHPVGDLRRDDGSFDLNPEDVDQWMTPPVGERVGSGHDGPTPTFEDEGDEGLEVVQASLDLRDGHLSGFVINGGDEYAGNVVVSIRSPQAEAQRVEIPFTLFKSESVPFRVKVQATSLEDIEVTVTGQRSTQPPLERAMAINPAFCADVLSEADSAPPLDDDLAERGQAASVCSVTAEIVPVTQGDVSKLSIAQPTLFAAALDSNGRVVAVGDIELYSFDGRNGPLSLDLSFGAARVARPAGATSVLYYAYGARQ